MKIIKCRDYEQMSRVAADIVAEEIKSNSKAVLGLATGSTPEGMYAELVSKYKNGEIDFSEVVSFNLDEYINLPEEDVNSYHYFMNQHLFNHVNIKKENTNVPDGNAKDIDEYSRRYDEMISDAGGIDIQVLGIGPNAHIGFNEPSSAFKVGTSKVKLKKSTIEANSRFFESADEVPKYAISMGIGSIFRSKKILLLASGKEKAKAVYDMLNSEIDPKIPASILRIHPNVVVVVDEKAASLI